MTKRDPNLDADRTEPALLRSAVAAARAVTPSPADLARIAAKLPLGGGIGGGGGPHPSGPPPVLPPPTAVAVPSIVPGVVVGAALGLITAGAIFVWQARGAPPSAPTPAAVTAASTLVSDRPNAPSDAPMLADTPIAAPPPAAPPRSSTGTPRVEAREGAAQPAASNDTQSPPAVESQAESEAHLLQRAQDALATNPDRALALTDEHARRFASGALGQEREVLAIQALLRLGRTAEARSRADRFMSAHPESAHRRRLEALLAP